MNDAVPQRTFDIRVEDHDCVRPDGSVMAVRVARPVGDGPFPAVIDVHGGGWVMGDRKMNAIIDDFLARNGIIAAAPEFRMPPAVRYPEPIADVHLAIRWLKANAARLGSRADLVGGVGTSSGGHQLLECVLRPNDSRYSTLALAQGADVDASLGYVVACWPVADPLRRFHYAQERSIKNLLDAHAAYWPNEAAMADGNPQLVIERGQNASLPPMMVLQGTNDDNLPADMATRLTEAWRKAGGDVTLREFAGQPHTFVTRKPDDPDSKEALRLMAEFIRRQARV